jgi:hypothetical protein
VKHAKYESEEFGIEPTRETFVDALREEFHHFGNYNDQYTRWTNLH